MQCTHKVYKLIGFPNFIKLFYLEHRTKSVASLTVSGDIHERETVTMNLSSVSGENILQLTNESAIYVAGFPRNMTVSPI